MHKKAILGMEAAWNRRVPQEDLWHSGELQAIRDWRRLARAHAIKPIAHSKKLVSNGVESFPLAHGSFDNDIDVVTATLHRILGGAGLTANVENLKELK